MMKKKTNLWARAKYLCVLPLAAVSMNALAGNGVNHVVNSAPMELAVPDEDDDTIYDMVDVMAEFPGGMKECMKYLAKELKYPEKAQKKGQSGRVIVKFVVDKKGKITQVEAIRGDDKALMKEAVRAVKGMPRWTPAMKDGKPVNSRLNLPVMFRLNNARTRAK